MKTTKKTTKPKEIIIDLNDFTPAERKMYDIGLHNTIEVDNCWEAVYLENEL